MSQMREGDLKMNINAIEKSVMTADEAMLKVMAESMPYEIYSRLSVDARSRLAKVYRKEVPGSAPYSGVPHIKAHRKLTEKERDRMIDLWASGPLTYRPDIDNELMKLGLVQWYDDTREAVDTTGVQFYDKSGRILPEWYDYRAVM